jgi:hypothetical protein
MRGGFNFEAVADLDAEVRQDFLGQDQADSIADLPDLKERFHWRVMSGRPRERQWNRLRFGAILRR